MAKKIISCLICLGMLLCFLPAVSCGSAVSGNENPFDDIAVGKWYTSACLWCSEKGYITGMDKKTFGPDYKLTRAQIVQILARVDGADFSSVSYSGKFRDVKSGDWFAKGVQWAIDCKVTKGISETVFSPESAVTREQLCQFLMSYASHKKTDVSKRAGLDFSDAGSVSPWAVDCVKWAVAQGLISGSDVNGALYLLPKENATRAQTATILKRFVTDILSREKPDETKHKKYFTICFDDGITQDLKIIEIYRKYGFTGGTFYLNTGLCGVSWEWVGEVSGMPGLSHKRFTVDELKSGIYDGFDTQVHTLNHISLKSFDNNPEKLKAQVQKDADNILEYTGVKPVGMAWPGGETEFTEKTIKIILENTDIRFGRCITPTYSFALPEYFMTWYPTCSISDPSLLDLAQRFISEDCKEDMLFFVWGHGYELDLNNSYGTLEKLIKMMTEADDVEIVTNAGFYELFKDEIPSWK